MAADAPHIVDGVEHVIGKIFVLDAQEAVDVVDHIRNRTSNTSNKVIIAGNELILIMDIDLLMFTTKHVIDNVQGIIEQAVAPYCSKRDGGQGQNHD